MRGRNGGFRTVPEVAKLLKLGVTTTYRLISEGKIRAVKIGGSIRVTDEEIDRLRQGEAA